MHHCQQDCEQFWTKTYQDMQVSDRRLSRGSEIVTGVHPIGGLTIAIGSPWGNVDIVSERRLDAREIILTALIPASESTVAEITQN